MDAPFMSSSENCSYVVFITTCLNCVSLNLLYAQNRPTAICGRVATWFVMHKIKHNALLSINNKLSGKARNPAVGNRSWVLLTRVQCHFQLKLPTTKVSGK